MTVGQAPFLPFDAINEAFGRSKDFPFCQKLNEFFVLQMKHPGDNVIPVTGFLARKEFPLNLLPRRVARESDEKVRCAIHPDIGHGILCLHVHDLVKLEGRIVSLPRLAGSPSASMAS